MKTIVSFLIFITCSQFLVGQQTIAIREAIKRETTVWYGIDFSKARLLGNFQDPNAILNAYLDIWNTLIIEGFSGHRSMKRILEKKDLVVDLNPVIKNNRSIKVHELFAYDNSLRPIFDTVLIQSVIEGYKLIENNGLGLVLVIETCNKYTETASGYFVIFSNNDKKVLYSKYFIGEASGVGMDKHWARGLYELIEDWSCNAGFSCEDYTFKRKKPVYITY